MANFNVYIQYNGGKGNTVAWEFPDGNTTGTGTSSGNPLDVDVNDTVTFIAQGGPGRVTISGLDIFTTNTDFQLAFDGNGLSLPFSETRTVASGGLTSDTLTASLSSGAVDNYYVERQAPTGTLTPASFATTESQGGVTVTANVSATGTYYWDLERNAGEPTGGNSFGFNAPTFGSLSLTANTDQDFTTGAPNQSGGSTSNIGYQGVSFTIDLFTGASRTGTLLDTSNWTIYETITGLSVGSSSINLGSGVSTFSQNVTTNWRGSDTVSLRIRNTTLSTTVDSFSTSNGSTTLSRTGITGPPQGTTYNYRVEAFNGNAWLTNGPTFSVSRDAAAPDAPTDITFGADPGTESATVSITCTASGGGTGTLQVSEDNSTWVANGSSFTFTRNTAKTIYARVNDGGNVSSSYSEANTVGYLLPDRDVNFSVDQSSISSGYAGNVILTVTNGSAGNMYRALRTTGGNAGMGNTGYLSGTTTGTVTIGDAAGELPAEGGTNSYTIQARRAVYAGGDNATWYNTSPLRTFTITRTDGTPNAYTIPDVTNAALGAEQNVNVQITGITESVTVSRTSGTATFAISSTSTTPSSGFSSTAKQITNNQYLHVKQNSSGTSATTLNSGFSVGGVTDTFSNTTAGAGDVTITIVYDEESSTFLPAPSFSPVVSGQNGLSNGQAYEVTAGTDVIFQNTSDPGSSTVVVSSLNSFTNNTSFNLAQGQSVTRTWASGVLGNSVDTIDLTTTSATEQVFLKQPAVDPDLNVSPVTPANRAFNDTATFNVTVNNVTSGETYKITENNFTTSLGSATASGTSVTIPMTIGNAQANTYGNLAVGATKTYEIHASRPANLGGTGSFVPTDDVFTVTRNTEPVSVPTDIVFSDPGTNDNNVNITVTASGGSGGTLQVSDDNSNWDANGTTYAAIRGTQGTYYARRLGSQGASVSTTRTENYTPPYRSPDSNITTSGTAKNATISPGATANLTLTISNGGSLDEYRILTTDTNTPLASGASVGSITGNGSITISSGEQPDVQGTSAGYKVQVRRPTATGGNNTFADTGDTFTITRQAISAPTNLTFGTSSTASANVSISVTASGGANGTIQLSETSNFSSTVSNGSSFTFTRGTAKTIYARRVDGAVASGTYSESNTVGYLLPDLGVSPSNVSIAFDAASAIVPCSGLTAGETYAVRLNNGSTNLTSRTPTGTTTNFTVSSSLPTVGNVTTYEIFARRPVSTGGDGSTYYQTDDTFTITRNVEPVTTPTDIAFSDPGTNDDNVNITCTASGGSGGTLQVSQDNTNWVANGTAFAFVRGTQRTIYARRLGSGSVTSSYSENYTPPYRSPDSNITLSGTANNATISPGATGSLTLTISNGGTLDQYRVLTTDTNTPLASGASVGSRTGNGNITIASGEQPDVQGTSAGYKVQVRRPTATGGNNTYADTGDTFTITRQAISAPTDLTFGTSSTGSANVSISVTASGGANGTIQLSETSNFSSTVSNGSSFTFTRGTAKTIYARRIDGAVTSSTYSESNTVGYLLPDLNVSPSDDTITFNASSAVTTVTGVTIGETYAVRLNNGSTNLAVNANVTGTTTNITLSSNLPTVGNTTTYEIFARRPVSTGGDGSTYYATNDIFTVTRTVEAVTAPNDITFGADPGTRDELVSISCTASGGSGGNLEVSQDNTNWFNSPQNFTFVRGTPKTIYARRNGAGNVSSSYSEAFTASYIAPDTSVAVSIVSNSISPGHTANITANISGGTQGDQIQLRTNDTNTPLASGTSVGTATFNSSGNASITISSGEQPTLEATANTATYRAFVRTPTGSGGDNAYDSTSATDTITRQIHTAPTDLVLGTDPGTADEVVSISVTASGGTYGTLQVSGDNTNWVANGSSFNFNRGTGRLIYARRLDGSVASASYSEVLTAPYLLPDLSVSASNAVIAFSATFATTVVSAGSLTDTYAVRVVNGSTTLGSRIGNGPINFSNGIPNVGDTSTYEIYARRPTTTGGDGSTYYDTNVQFTVERTVENVTAPTDIQFTDPGTNDDNVLISALGVGGSGGTIKVSESVSSGYVTNNSSFSFIRGTPKTIYTRREGSGATSSVYSESYTPAYRTPDSNITTSGTAKNATISPGATANLTLTISNGGTLDQYRILTTDTNTPLASGASVGSITGNGSITISSGEQPDVQGTSAGYKVQVRRPTASGGNNTYADTGDTFTITRQAISAPTDLTFGTSSTGSANVSISVTASGGTNGTIQLSETSNFSSTQANGTSFTFTRGTAKTIYARRVDGAVASGTYSESNTVGYLLPDLIVSPSNDTIAFDATSAETTVTGVTIGETYAVRLNNGSTNLAVNANVTGTTTNLNFSSSLPTVGNTTTYEIFARRPVSAGGDGSTYYQTNDTFTVTRNVEGLTPPTDIAFSDPGTNDDNVNITVTASGGAGGTLKVSDDNTTFVANGTAFAAIRGTEATYYARREGVGANSTTYSENYEPPFRAPDTSITATPTATTISPGSTATVNVAIAGCGNAFDQYRILTTDTNTPQASGANVGSRTSNGNIALANSELPDVQGTSAGYKVQARRPTANGGSNGYVDTGVTFTISRQAISAPTNITFGSDPGTSSATVSITVTASGGTNGTIQLSETSNFSSTQANGTSFTFTRGTAKTIYARRVDGAVASGTYSESNTVGYLLPDLNVSPSDDTIAFDAVEAVTTVTGVTIGETYAVRLNNGSTNLAVNANITGTTTNLNFSSSLPTVGNTTTYEIFARRPVSAGGDGSTYYQTNDTFTVTRNAESVTPPTDIVFGEDPGTSSASVSITVTASGGAGGTLKVSETAGFTTSLANGSSFTFTRGTPKTIYARREGSGANSSNYSEENTVPFLDPVTSIDNIQNQNYFNGTGNSSFDILINNGDSNTTYQVRTGSNSGTIVTSRVGDGTITVNQFPSDNSSTTYYLTAFRSTSSGGGGSGVVSAVQTFIISATAQASGNDAGGATGTSNYGFEVYGPDGETIVWGTNNRQTNLQVLDVKTFTSSDNSKFYACPDADDNTKVVVSVGVPNPTTGPIAQRASEGVVVTKTSTGFTVTVNGLVASLPGVTQLTVRSIAARIA